MGEEDGLMLGLAEGIRGGDAGKGREVAAGIGDGVVERVEAGVAGWWMRHRMRPQGRLGGRDWSLGPRLLFQSSRPGAEEALDGSSASVSHPSHHPPT